MTRLKVMSTFTGVGGIDLPFHKSDDFEVIGFSEIDEAANKVLRYRFPKIKNFGDITKIDPNKLPDFDILTGGFPCTDISTQGTQKGILEGKKSSLFHSMLPIIKNKKPKYILIENVKSLLNINGGWDFKYVREKIKEQGYEVYYELLDATDFGVPQKRERVFIFAVREDGGTPKINSSTLSSWIEKSKKEEIKDPNGMLEELDEKQEIISWSKSTRKKHIDYRMREDGMIGTLTTGKGCCGFSTGTMILTSKDVRLLTPLESEKFMGWENNMTLNGIDEKGNKVIIPDSKRYRLCGNGVIPQCVYPIRDLILQIENTK